MEETSLHAASYWSNSMNLKEAHHGIYRH